MSVQGRRPHPLVVAVALVVALTACAPDRAPRPVDEAVRLQDFKIHVGTRPLHSGVVVLGLRNEGPTVHELLVARTNLPADHLPLGKDGLSVDEDAKVVNVVKELEEVQLGDVHDLAVTLPAGHYVLFCNLEGHYLGGMHADLVVQP